MYMCVVTNDALGFSRHKKVQSFVLHTFGQRLELGLPPAGLGELRHGLVAVALEEAVGRVLAVKVEACTATHIRAALSP